MRAFVILKMFIAVFLQRNNHIKRAILKYMSRNMGLSGNSLHPINHGLYENLLTWP